MMANIIWSRQLKLEDLLLFSNLYMKYITLNIAFQTAGQKNKERCQRSSLQTLND